MLAVEAIKQQALDLGFDLVGITDAAPLGHAQVQYLRTWLDAGHAGSMTYMHRNLEKRTHPDVLYKGARSVIVVGLNYKTPGTGSEDAKRGSGQVTHYACYEDYHGFIKDRLFLLADFIRASHPTTPGFKVCVDSVPLAERALAVRAGLGFIAQNHMLAHPVLGQEILLGEIISTLPLPCDSPSTRLCRKTPSSARERAIFSPGKDGEAGDVCSIVDAAGCRQAEKGPLEARSGFPTESSVCTQCRRCITACPTGALRADGQLDAGKCINYLTIEHRADIHPSLAVRIGTRVYGCDECVKVCPWHADAPACRNRDFKYYPERHQLDLNAILNWKEPMFQEQFHNSPVLRIGLAQLQRNAKICLSNLPTQQRNV